MIEGCAKFCKAVKERQKPFWLSLIGGSGGGKTHLAKRIWKWFQTTDQFRSQVDRDWDGRKEITYPGQFCWWPEVSKELSANRGYDKVDELMREKFVVLDEIGADRDPNGHCKDHLARILCSRVGKWTLLTSNKTLEDIARDIDTRVASRMIRDGSIVVEIDVRDYWLRK